ncbi:hypothetical protein F2Q69_00020570 [Brassica cretica]|uniref:Uncharacterized protein n=1 Tax=Brassica cretica TaxID=69181 RepID=A0A8S9QEP5_BRACR|nr:hypothetical protein F2Q69_00020570 [Brassica cretica]
MSSQLTRLQRNHLLLSPLLLAPPCKGHGAASATRPPASRSELNRPEKNIKLHSPSSISFSGRFRFAVIAKYPRRLSSVVHRRVYRR